MPKSWKFPEALLILCQIPQLGNAASDISEGEQQQRGQSILQQNWRQEGWLNKQRVWIIFFLPCPFTSGKPPQMLPIHRVSCPTSIKRVRSTQLNLKFDKLTITMYVDTPGGQKASNTLELELLVIVSAENWMRVLYKISNCWVIFPAHGSLPLNLLISYRKESHLEHKHPI